jgi:hypothetical protein
MKAEPTMSNPPFTTFSASKNLQSTSAQGEKNCGGTHEMERNKNNLFSL